MGNTRGSPSLLKDSIPIPLPVYVLSVVTNLFELLTRTRVSDTPSREVRYVLVYPRLELSSPLSFPDPLRLKRHSSSTPRGTKGVLIR